MTNRFAAVVVALLTLVACNGKGSPAAPTPPPPTPPAAALVALAGTVSATSGTRISGATVAIQDGPNVGKSTSSDSFGNYRFGDLVSGNANLGVSAIGYLPTGAGVFINGINVLHFTLAAVPPPPLPPSPLFKKSGTGNTVFDMPLTVRRIRIVGTYNGSCQNFIVHIGRDFAVNEILGTCSISSGTRYDGIHLTSGGITEVLSSNGVSWSFTEVRL